LVVKGCDLVKLIDVILHNHLISSLIQCF